MFFRFYRRKIRRYRRVPTRRKLATGDPIIHQGEQYALRIANDTGQPQGCAITGEHFEVNLHDVPFAKSAWQDDVRLEIILWHKKQARRIIQERTEYWSKQLDVSYRRLTASNPLRLWGSCSARDDIRINWRLIMAPPDLLDYVIVHELCHVTHKNHSKRFWNMVAQYIPDWKSRRLALRTLNPAADV